MTWNVLLTNPNSEHKVSMVLDKKGMLTYYPIFKYPRIYRHEVRMCEKAAFSRYVFIHVPFAPYLLANTPGLEGVMQSTDGYSWLPDSEVENIMLLERKGFFTEENLTIVNNLQTKVIGMASRGKAKVEVQLFGSTREATVKV
jgi:transcription antitermination factor NusG